MQKPNKTTDTNTLEDARILALSELIGCIGVIAKRYPDTIPGAMATICLNEIHGKLIGEAVTEFISGDTVIEYSRLSDLLTQLDPVSIRPHRAAPSARSN